MAIGYSLYMLYSISIYNRICVYATMKYKDVARFEFSYQIHCAIRRCVTIERSRERDERYRYLAGFTLQEGQV